MKSVVRTALLATATTARANPCPIIIDVRDTADGIGNSRAGFESGHISCAISVPKDEFTAWLEKNKDGYKSNQPFYTYCYSGNRSGKAKEELVTAGFSNAKNGGSYFVEADKKVLNELCDTQKKCVAGSAPSPIDDASGSSSLQGPAVLSLALAVVGCASLM